MGKRKKYDSDLPKKEYRKLYLELEGYNSREKKMELDAKLRKKYREDEAYREAKRKYARIQFEKKRARQRES